jgi:hypothetical protein
VKSCIYFLSLAGCERLADAELGVSLVESKRRLFGTPAKQSVQKMYIIQIEMQKCCNKSQQIEPSGHTGHFHNPQYISF